MRVEENGGNWAKVARARVQMTQAEFAAAFNLNLRTVQDWEQGRYKPDQIAMNYLRLIIRAPDVVRKALSKAA
ncbi:MAG: transcriptional regulator [Rhodospirillaceae bacterium]|nr:transcriptional regulator [Rhodospirillaceae bacterium]